MAIKFGKGRSTVTISGALGDDIEAELRSILGPVADEMQREADRIMDEEIRPKWPINTGASLAAWKTYLRIQPDSFKVEIVLLNDLPYTNKIKSSKVGDRDDATRYRSPTTVLVRKPATLARRRLIKAIPELLAKHLSDEVL